jgi:hypothetical protein
MNVEITVDGKRLPLNAFTQAFIGNVSVAIAGSLRGVEPNWKEVVIRIAQ